MKLWTHFLHYCSQNPDKAAAVLFYVGTIILAFVAYIQARKELFSPLRTEKFRYTTKLLTEIQEYLISQPPKESRN
jgi:hypothetical protein